MNQSPNDSSSINRRDFFKVVAAAGAGVIAANPVFAKIEKISTAEAKPKTNIADALKYPRTKTSMPGKYPGKVIQIEHSKCIEEKKINSAAAEEMITEGMNLFNVEVINFSFIPSFQIYRTPNAACNKPRTPVPSVMKSGFS